MNNFTTDKDESTTETVDSTDGTLGLALTWGNNFPLGAGLLKPEIEFGYAFDLDTQKITTKATGNTATNHRDGYSILSAGLRGTYEFAPGAASQASLTVEEALSIRLYPDPVSTNPASDTTTYQKGHHVTNSLAAVFRKTYDIDERFSAGWGAGLTFNMVFQKNKTELKTAGTTAVTANEDTTTITVTPRAGLGFVYRFVPDRFSLNGGAGVDFQFQNIDWKNHEASGAGTLAKRTTTSLSGLVPRVNLGGTFYITPQFLLDFSAATGASGSFSLTTTQFTFLASLKY
jgi:hypothetical protein